MFFDGTYILLLPAIIISFWAQSKINSTFEKYSRVRSMNGYSGAQAARMLLDEAGLYNVPIELVGGSLTDHYDPRSKVLRLSNDVYYSNSVASIGVAAHEVGHAIQHQKSYAPLMFRNMFVPVANIGNGFSWILFFLGIAMGFKPLVTLGILLFSAVVIFQIVTLPVEYNASTRALRILENRGILYSDEVKGAEKVLDAAALTYVAATLMAISQLLRLLAISNNRND